MFLIAKLQKLISQLNPPNFTNKIKKFLKQNNINKQQKYKQNKSFIILLEVK